MATARRNSHRERLLNLHDRGDETRCLFERNPSDDSGVSPGEIVSDLFLSKLLWEVERFGPRGVETKQIKSRIQTPVT